MDTLKIFSKFTNGIISKILTKVIRKKIGTDVEILFHEIKAHVDDNKVHMHVEVDLDMSKDDFDEFVSRNLQLL